MTLPKNSGSNESTRIPIVIVQEKERIRAEEGESISSIAVRLEELESLPHRNAILHWAAFTLSLLSTLLLSFWVFSGRGPVPAVWLWVDIGVGMIFGVEFFTRSGFRWGWSAYLGTHFFDFIAIVPALVLVNRGFAIESVWVWIILVARSVRVVDRFLGDGFVQRTILAIIEGFEEEMTDRVLGRIIARVQEDMGRADFSHAVAGAFIRNREAVLQRIRAATPREGVVPGLAHLVGLDAALERTEAQTYDAIVGIIDSEEVESAVRDIVNSSFSGIRNELKEKSWRRHLGIKRHESR